MEYSLMFVIIVIVLLLTIALGRYHEKKQWMYLEKKCKEQYGRETDKKYKYENWNHIDAYLSDTEQIRQLMILPGTIWIWTRYYRKWTIQKVG